MALPAETLQIGGIVAVCIAALRLAEVLTVKFFGNGRGSRVDHLERNMEELTKIVSGKDEEGALLLYYPRRVYNAVEILSGEVHKMSIALSNLANDIRSISQNSARTMDAVRTCESLNRMRETQHIHGLMHDKSEKK